MQTALMAFLLVQFASCFGDSFVEVHLHLLKGVSLVDFTENVFRNPLKTF